MKPGGKVEMVSALYGLFHRKQLLTLVALVIFATLYLIGTATVGSQGLHSTLLGHGGIVGGILACTGLKGLTQGGPEHLGSFAIGFNGTKAMGTMQELGDSIIPALYASERYKEMRDKYPGSKVSKQDQFFALPTVSDLRSERHFIDEILLQLSCRFYYREGWAHMAAGYICLLWFD